MKSILLLCLFLAVTVSAKSIPREGIKSNIPLINERHNPGTDARIIGGQNATLAQFLHQMAIWSDNSYLCGGALISDTVVVTAAQCVEGFSKHLLMGGGLQLLNYRETARVYRNTTEHHSHPEYLPPSLNNDIAFFSFNVSLSGPKTAPIQLQTLSQSNATLEGRLARISGWGTISDASSEINKLLQFTDVVISNHEECVSLYGPEIVGPCQMCARAPGAGFCTSDTGGPLITLFEGDVEPTLVGLASFVSTDGCEADVPQVYTRMACYLQWLQDEAGVLIRP